MLSGRYSRGQNLQKVGHVPPRLAHGGGGGERGIGCGVDALVQAILDHPVIPPVGMDLDLQQSSDPASALSTCHDCSCIISALDTSQQLRAGL